MTSYQHTLKHAVQCTGVGLHSGKDVTLTIKPAPVNHGIKFVRVDLAHKPVISAHFRNVIDTSLATTIGMDGVIVSTIEHLMATFAGLHIDNVSVEMDAHEVPIMDGSAGPFSAMIKEAGIKAQSAKRQYFVVKEPIEMTENGKKVGLFPSDLPRVTCTIDFDHPMLRNQSYSIMLDDGFFETEISRARTFGFLHEVDYLKRNGFAKGGSLENAIVIDNDKILNPEGLRYKDEFIRHKILDCVGDLSMLGMPIIGHIVAHKSGHALNHSLLKRFINQKSCWETVQA
ncbi:MAG: UDP-3-O-acyl-N-acetylglucosamine deacetylase [Deltaproteobacteria bacterium]|jgi:UDP-3-O-[3-hydroxymyristoyl] N-acetylglucosamine deacetylase|nr:UDP-3-O-acyl-N-acetylglucosamine deacetylase [Deltaproteobacteria bacterium]MBW2317592.1 UDP-3-O-acyl-N-acetylglucosamine deacetylase [Deltaproteobacteria bacterium]OEU45116.1 MAG: UDP-3-O-[3-hydroxymyristoyl] N-acetylglucosamine deacetylase [Desulfobacterales bacterium S7086C20]